MAVFGAVQLTEAIKRGGEPHCIERAIGKRHAQLVTLADIAQIAGVLVRGIARPHAVVGELARELLLHRCKIAVEAVEISAFADLEFGADRIVLKVGGEETDRRRDAGIGRHDDLWDAEQARHLGAVQRTRAAERDQHEMAGIEALLYRARTDRVRHIGVDDGEDALSRGLKRQPQPIRQSSYRAARGFGIEPHRSTEEIVRVEPS